MVNPEDQVLIGKREGSHAPYFSIPGGYLEPGESFEVAAIREVKEETGLEIANPVVMGVSNKTLRPGRLKASMWSPSSFCPRSSLEP